LKLGLGLGIGLFAALVVIAVAAPLVQYYKAADYPGATQVSDHTVTKVLPSLTLRRDTSYRTQDAFPVVYNWYSSGFRLGPERRAQSACILMERSQTWLAVEQRMSVMLCDTSSGRMIFVMRSIGLRSRSR
jgi:hypothetical protein